MNDLERLAFELRLPSGSKPTRGAREIFERVRRRLVERYNEPSVGQVEKGHIQTVLKVLVRSVKADFVDPSLRVDREEAARICEILAPWLPDPLASDPPNLESVTDPKSADSKQVGAPGYGVENGELANGVDRVTRSFRWGAKVYGDLSDDVLRAMEQLVENYHNGRPTPKANLLRGTDQESLGKLFRSGDAPAILKLFGSLKGKSSVQLESPDMG